MDENNGQKNAVQQVADKVKDEAKNKAKKSIMQAIKPMLPGILSAVGIFFLCLLAVGVINLIPYLIKDLFSSIFSIFKKNNNTDTTSNEISQSLIYIDENSGAYKLIGDDLAEQILNELENQAVDCELIGLDKNMLNKYIETEVKTTYPKTGLSQNDIDGRVIIKRASATNKNSEQKLSYKKYSDFCSMVEGHNANVFNYYTINPDTMELCIARKDTSITYYDSNGQSVSMPDSRNNGWKIDLFDYYKYVENHSVSFNFLLNLHLSSQDVNFMNEVLDMILNDNVSEPVVLTYVDTSYKDEINITYTGSESYKFEYLFTEVNNEYNDEVERKKAELQEKEIEIKSNILTRDKFIDEQNKLTTRSISNASQYLEETPEYYKEIIETNDGELYVTKADTWLKKFNKNIDESFSEPINEISEPMDDEVESILYVQPVEITESGKTKILYYKKVSTIKITKNIKTEGDYRKFVLTETENELRVDDFVELIQKYPNVENNLTTAPSNLFYLLQQNENTQVLEQVMRYVIYMLSDIDYGVNRDILEELLEEYTFVEYTGLSGLRAYLLQFSHGIGYEAPQRTVDGVEFYKLYGDSIGWPTIGNDDLQWKSNYGKFLGKPGKIMHNGEIIETSSIGQYINDNFLTKSASESENGEGGPSAKYTNEEISEMDVYIEKAVVDDVGSDVVENHYQHVLTQTSGLNLSTQQIYALTAITHNFGNMTMTRDSKTFLQVYEEATEAGYEEKSWEHNRYVWDNWWCKLGGGEAGHVIARDEQFETYVKGTLNFSLSKYGWLTQRTYMYYTEEQLKNLQGSMNEGKNVPINGHERARNAETEEELFTTEEILGKYIQCDEDYISGYYTSTSGRTFTIISQSKLSNTSMDGWTDLNTRQDKDWGLNDDYGPGWSQRCNRVACTIIASGYSNETPKQLIATMNNLYDRDDIPDKYWDEYGLTVTKYTSVETSLHNIKVIMRTQLQKGGYVTVWMHNKNGYVGASGKEWTGDRHWVAVIDYKVENGEEYIAIADGGGCSWYKIGEFREGVSAYALIEEK